MKKILLIHGAYQGGWIWRDVAERLRSTGAQVLAPSLDGCGERSHSLRPGITTESQAEELAKLLFYEDWQDVTIAGASLGGMVMCRLAELVPERVGQLIFADAVALQDGERLSDFVKRPPSPVVNHASGPDEAEASSRLFADVETHKRAWAASRTTRHPIDVLEQPVKLESFWRRDWRASVIWCRTSFNPSRETQQRTARLLHANWIELDCGHYPMLTHPIELADAIVAEMNAPRGDSSS